MRYREGTIYNFFSPNTNQCYIGCTTKDLKPTFTHLRAYSKRNRGVISNVIIEAETLKLKFWNRFTTSQYPHYERSSAKFKKNTPMCVSTYTEQVEL